MQLIRVLCNRRRLRITSMMGGFTLKVHKPIRYGVTENSWVIFLMLLKGSKPIGESILTQQSCHIHR